MGGGQINNSVESVLHAEKEILYFGEINPQIETGPAHPSEKGEPR